MPDVTVKPLRSKGNAVINLMGTAGGIAVLVFGIIFKTGAEGKTDFLAYIIAVSALMAVGLIVFVLFVKEPLWAEEMREETEKYGLENETEPTGEGRKLTRAELTSLILILASVALWYTGYNAVTSKYSVYAEQVLKVDFNTTLIVAQAAAVISYIPVGIISSRIGRKKSILAGVAMLTAAFTVAIFLTDVKSEVHMFPIFALAGIGWATINVNSFPMAVELAKAGDVGKYTGYYYTASMAAQIVTPIISGALVDKLGWWIFFPYAAAFVALAFVTMCFVKHGDSTPERLSALEALGGAED
jgi:MFS family permease